MTEDKPINEHWKNWIGWSFEREKIWNRCPLEFWAQYIGRWGSGAEAAVMNKMATLRTLRDQANTYLKDVIGAALHHAMLGRGMERHHMSEMFNRKMDFIPGHLFHIVENINGKTIHDHMIEEERHRGHLMLTSFYDTISGILEKAVPLDHGRILSYDVDGHRVWLNIDVALMNKEKRIIVMNICPDGIPEGKMLMYQLASRALWAMKVYRLPHNKVTIESIDLGDLLATSLSFSTPPEEDILMFKRHVISRCKEWEQLRDEEDVTAEPEPSKCETCAFLTRCGAKKT